MNPMQQIIIEKVTLNIGVGEAGDKLTKAMRLLNTISGAVPVGTTSEKRIPTWGVRPNVSIACKVTVRGKKAEELLGRLFVGVDKKIKESKFDKYGNLSFGVPEYINIPNVPYDVEVGIIGLDVSVTLERAGFRVGRRRMKNKIPARHRISKEEAVKFIQEKYNIEVLK